jgi:transcriptional regulator with XRE-family HTH domain
MLVTGMYPCHADAVSEDWSRLGDAVRARRENLGWTQTEAVQRSEGGISISVWRAIENAFRPPFSRPKLAVVCQVLRWAPESVDLLLKGGDAIEVDEAPAEPSQPVDDELRARVEALELRLARLENEDRTRRAQQAYQDQLNQQMREHLARPLPPPEADQGQRRRQVG